jgi:DNA-binding NarL/FixJ family response regulator
MATRVLIADGQQLVRLGLRRMLDDHELEVCGEAITVAEILATAAYHAPDILVSETHLAGVEVVSILPQLRDACPNTAVLIFSASDNPLDEARAFAAGIKGFVSRTLGRDVLLAAIRTVSQGGSLWTGSDQRRLSSYLRAARPVVGDFAPLTPREEQILKLLTTGATNKEISESLGISHETVKEHVQHVLQKVGVTDRTQAAVWAVRNGLA